VGEATLALSALVVDDEAPAREELAFLLRDDPRVAQTHVAGSAGEALRILADQSIDVIFCDIKMPGLDGVELARVVSRFVDRPQIVFVTAYDDRAVEAFEVQAVDYLLKPVSPDRLAEAVRRAVSAGSAEHPDDQDETIPVELAGVTRFVRRSQIRFAEAQGDYVRLHTTRESHLLRVTLAELEQRWADAGFVRIHRSTLVSLAHVDEIRAVDGRYVVRIGEIELPVSRRHARELRERLVRRT
jgi:DNA-binding LytR/AlgR family response regulator